MKNLKRICGAASLACLIFGFNAVVLKQNPFSAVVLAPLGLGLVLGLAWIGITLYAMARHSGREGKSLYGLNTVVSSLLFLCICIIIYAFAAHGNRSWDLTEEGRRTLSDQTVQVLQNLSTDVNVIAFFLQTDDEFVRTGKDKTARFLEQCAQHTDYLKVEFLDPQIDRMRLEGLNVIPSPQGTVVIKCGLRQKTISLSGASPRLEERDFTNALINVIRETQPKVCFLSGHGERNIDDPDEKNGASMLKKVLEMEGYTAERIGIKLSAPEIPSDCDVLVINGLGLQGPQSDLHPSEIRAIEEYMDRGGRLLLLVDPWRKVTTGLNQSEQLLPWLKTKYGVIVEDGILVSPTSQSKIVVDLSANTDPFPDNPDSEFRGCFNAGHRITQNFKEQGLMQIARVVDLADPMPEGVTGTLLLRSTPDFYNESDLNMLLSGGRASKSAGERNGPLPLAVAVSAKTDFIVGDSGQTRDARLVVFGDSDFASNSQLTTLWGNLNLVLNTMAWLTESDELIAIRPTTKDDPPVILTESDQRTVVYVAVLGTVQAIVLAGLVAYFLRRKYQ